MLPRLFQQFLQFRPENRQFGSQTEAPQHVKLKFGLSAPKINLIQVSPNLVKFQKTNLHVEDEGHQIEDFVERTRHRRSQAFANCFIFGFHCLAKSNFFCSEFVWFRDDLRQFLRLLDLFGTIFVRKIRFGFSTFIQSRV